MTYPIEKVYFRDTIRVIARVFHQQSYQPAICIYGWETFCTCHSWTLYLKKNLWQTVRKSLLKMKKQFAIYM